MMKSEALLHLRGRTRSLERVVPAILVVGALTFSAAALYVAAGGQASPGFAFDEGVTVVTRVLPGGGAWRSGVRAGHEIMTLEPGAGEDDWLLTTRGEGVVDTPKRAMMAELRGTVPQAALGLLAAALAALMLPFGGRAAAALAVLALVLAQHPFLVAGDELPSALAAISVVAAPAVWLAAWPPTAKRPLLVAVVAGAVVVALAWMVARHAVPDAFDAVDTTRVLLAYGLAVAICLRVVREGWWTTGAYDYRDRTDLVVVASVIGGGVIALLLYVRHETIVVAAILALAVYPIIRGKSREIASKLVLGTVRERAAVAAMEEERGRLARDIHDEPLQAIAAVARSIDAHPDLATEAATLREVAAHLRAITGGLRPPALEDLGLDAAIQYAIRSSARDGDIGIMSELAPNATGGDPARPPPAVELALFRIVHEALHNAVEHSGAKQIAVSGHVYPDDVRLEVSDDGVGIDRETLRLAEAAGHMGIRSMRQRAALIDAELRIQALDPGTQVSVWWHR